MINKNAILKFISENIKLGLKDKTIKDLVLNNFKISGSSYYNYKKESITGIPTYKTQNKYLRGNVNKILKSKIDNKTKTKKIESLYKESEKINKKYKEYKEKRCKTGQIYRAKNRRQEQKYQEKLKSNLNIPDKDQLLISVLVKVSGVYYVYNNFGLLTPQQIGGYDKFYDRECKKNDILNEINNIIETEKNYAQQIFTMLSSYDNELHITITDYEIGNVIYIQSFNY